MSLPEKQPSTSKLSPVQLRQHKAAIVNNALLIGDTSHPAVVQKKLLASAPPCTCPAKTETCGKGCTSSSKRCKQERDKKGVWTQECLSKSQPVYRLFSGKTASNTDTDTDPLDCEESSCAEGGQVCRDPDTGCIRDECSDGCTHTVCPGDEETPDLTTPEGITKVTTEFLEKNPIESLASVIQDAGGYSNAWSLPGIGPITEGNKDGWHECTAKTVTTRLLTVWEDGVKISDSYDVLENRYDTSEMVGYSDYIWPGAKYDCKSASWLENPQGIVRIGTGTVSEKKHTTTTTCKDGVTHTREVYIEFFQETASFAQFSNHPGCPGMCPRKLDVNISLYCRERWWGSWNDLFNNGGGGLFPGEPYWQDGVTGYGLPLPYG